MTFSQAGAPLAVADGNGHAYVWDTASDKIVGTYAGTGSWPAWGVAFSPNGKLLAIADGDGNVYVRVTRQFVSQSAPATASGPVQLPKAPAAGTLVRGRSPVGLGELRRLPHRRATRITTTVLTAAGMHCGAALKGSSSLAGYHARARMIRTMWVFSGERIGAAR